MGLGSSFWLQVPVLLLASTFVSGAWLWDTVELCGLVLPFPVDYTSGGPMFAIQFSSGSWPRQIPRVHQSHLPMCWGSCLHRCDAVPGLQPGTWPASVLEVGALQVLSSVCLQWRCHGLFLRLFAHRCRQVESTWRCPLLG